MTSRDRHEISEALHVQVFSLEVGRRTIISPKHVGTVLPLDSENGCSWKIPSVSFPTIITGLPAVCHFLCATSNVGVYVRNPKSNSKMLSRIEVTSYRFLVPSGDLSTARFCHGLISHAGHEMTCKLVASYLCFRGTCCLNFQGRSDRHSWFPKNFGNQILSYMASHPTRQNCSVLTAPTSDCPPMKLVIWFKEREG